MRPSPRRDLWAVRDHQHLHSLRDARQPLADRRRGGTADICVHVDCTNYGIVEDLHQTVMHALAQYIRQSRMSADTISATTF